MTRPSQAQLLELLKAALPFSARVNKHRAAQNSGEKTVIRNRQRLQIEEVMDGGDVAGILCAGPIDGGKSVLAISLTHLRFEPSHPLYTPIRAYQVQRIKDLAARRLAEDARRRTSAP